MENQASHPESCSVETIESALLKFNELKVVKYNKKHLAVLISDKQIKNLIEQISKFLKDQTALKKYGRMMVMPFFTGYDGLIPKF